MHHVAQLVVYLQHKYIRVGGGHRHSFWYCKALIEEILLQKAKDAVLEKRLEAIHERRQCHPPLTAASTPPPTRMYLCCKYTTN